VGSRENLCLPGRINVKWEKEKISYPRIGGGGTIVSRVHVELCPVAESFLGSCPNSSDSVCKQGLCWSRSHSLAGGDHQVIELMCQGAGTTRC
jgi:hypothetical protein